jgi:hypothetical protein
MKLTKQIVAACLLATLALGGCASLGSPAGQANSARNASTRALFSCRFEQPGRGDRMLNRPARDPAIAACMARNGAVASR